MRLASLGLAVTLIGGVALWAAPASADRRADLATCKTAADEYDSDILDACDRFLEATGTSRKDRVAAYTSRARLLYNDEEFEGALLDIEAAIELTPSAELYRYSGLLHLQLEEPGKAVADLNRSIKLDPRSAHAFYLRGQAYWEREDDGDEDAAFADFARALDIDPAYSDVYLYRGRAYVELEENDKAINDFTDAIYFEESAAAYAARGSSYIDNGEARKAVADLTKSLSLDKSGRGGRVFTLLGRAHEALGEYDDAIKQFTAYIDARPQDLPHAYFTRGKCNAKKGDWQAAIADFTRAIEGSDSPSRSYFDERGKAYRSAGNFDSAIADFKANVANGFIYARPDLADTYRAMKDETNARAEYETTIAEATATIEKYPESAALELRGRANYALGEYAKAVEDFTKFIASAKYYKDEERAGFLTERADAYAALGDTVNAEADRAEAARLREAAAVRQNAPPEEVATRAPDDDLADDEGEQATEPSALDSRSRLDGAADINSGEGGIRSLGN